MLSHTTKIGSKVRQVSVQDYVGEVGYNNHIAVTTDSYRFVLNKETLELSGILGFDGISIENSFTATAFARLEQKYGFLKVAKAFVKGERGNFNKPCHTFDEDLERCNMYAILSPYVFEYWKFVVFSKSGASPTEIRKALYTLIGSIVVDLKPNTLQTILHCKGDLSQTKFLLESLQKCSVLYMEKNPIIY